MKHQASRESMLASVPIMITKCGGNSDSGNCDTIIYSNNNSNNTNNN